MLSYQLYGEPAEYEGVSESLFQLYRLRTAQCLIIGDIAKCLPYTLETLRFNATAELNRKDDNSRGLWIMTGVIVRAAINMGYHRDPSQSSSISVFQAEYRRRVWLSISGMDDMASFLAGFPRMLPLIYSDTAEPRNLHEWELSVDDTVLPPSRPLSEPTLVTYMIVKGRLFHALGKITDFYNTPNWGSYDSVLEIDKILREAYETFPLHMKVTSRSKDFTAFQDKFEFSKLQMEAMYHKGMCILHRKFIAKARSDPKYNISRSRCISSALVLLQFQGVLEPEWYKFAQTRQLLTLPAMILFLELEYRRKGSDIDTSSDTKVILNTLEMSCAHWRNAKSSCDEAYRIYHILNTMLLSFTKVTESTYSHTNTPDLSHEFLTPSPQFYQTNGGISLDKDIFGMSNEMDIDWVSFPYKGYVYSSSY